MDNVDAAETIELGNILSTIASVPPDADKDTLVAAIDQTVDSVIAGMGSLEGEAPPPDLLKAAQVTIGFLQACGELGDVAFRAHIKTRHIKTRRFCCAEFLFNDEDDDDDKEEDADDADEAEVPKPRSILL